MQTERTPSVERARGVRLEPYLFLVIEGSRLAAGGLRVALGGLETLQIGRGHARALERPSAGGAASLRVPDARMSGAHARIVKRNGTYVLEDLGSTNGTLVNGSAITTETVLNHDDLVELGQTFFTYRELEEEAFGRAMDVDLDAARAVLPGMRTLDPNVARGLERLARVAPSLVSVLLLGETGTGKEVLARDLHVLSGRPGPFVAVNCGAIPGNLVEAFLFGHVRGAYSGAVRDEPGMVRAANFGTLLLDEIGDLALNSQAALLRVLQEGEVVSVGATKPTKVDVRVIAATHMPLKDLVEQGTFRRDLYARLTGYTFNLAPLRERKVDVGLYIAGLLDGGKVDAARGLRLHCEATRALMRHDWPMNVRELEQCLRSASVLAQNGILTVHDLGLSADAPTKVADAALDGRDDVLRRELVLRIAEANGNVTEVARAMGKARQQVQRWLRRFQIHPEAYRPK